MLENHHITITLYIFYVLVFLFNTFFASHLFILPESIIILFYSTSFLKNQDKKKKNQIFFEHNAFKVI